jgi:hypothetical protein
MSSVLKLFGGGSGQQAQQQALMQMISQQGQAQAMRNAQGRQLAELAKAQGEADLESANMKRPGLGRALLKYGGGGSAATLGGG